MILSRTKEWWKFAIARAERTVAQTLLSMLPVSIVITPTMLQNVDINLLYVILAWLITGIIGGFTSILTSYVKGLPELGE